MILKLASNYAGATDNNWSRVLLIAFIAALLFSGLDLLFDNFIINLIALAIALIVIAQLLKVPNDMLTVFCRNGLYRRYYCPHSIGSTLELIDHPIERDIMRFQIGKCSFYGEKREPNLLCVRVLR